MKGNVKLVFKDGKIELVKAEYSEAVDIKTDCFLGVLHTENNARGIEFKNVVKIADKICPAVLIKAVSELMELTETIADILIDKVNGYENLYIAKLKDRLLDRYLDMED